MAAAGTSRVGKTSPELRYRSLFGLPTDFFDSCRLVSSSTQFSSSSPSLDSSPGPVEIPASEDIGGVQAGRYGEEEKGNGSISRWSCNTCKVEFESLQDQRSHFKSDLHRYNVKLNLAGKKIFTEEEFDERLGSEDCDVSSISGSEDELEEVSASKIGASGKVEDIAKQKLFFRLKPGGLVSVWKCLVCNEYEDYSINFSSNKIGVCNSEEEEVIDRLRCLICEPRDKTRLRIVLLASGGHFAGCVFDGISVVAHKTFHRYVVRAKAGKRQSTKDATGKAAKSAGSSLRRYNELALKKEVQELLASWKPYFDATSCVFIHAPSNNRQLFYDGEKPLFSGQQGIVRHVPFTVRRPTLKEAKRIYNQITMLIYEIEEIACSQIATEDPELRTDGEGKDCIRLSNENVAKPVEELGKTEFPHRFTVSSGCEGSATFYRREEIPAEPIENEGTALHEAAKSGDIQRILELLEEGLDPCAKDSRGRTPYMVAAEKEVRNTFRRFMALNLNKWDWKAANVPSALSKEMEEAQAAKQAEKDAKRKAKAKELKKLKKAKEKAQAKAQAEIEALVRKSSSQPQGSRAMQDQVLKRQPQVNPALNISKEEEMKRVLAEEREKRAAAAERRIAALKSCTTTQLTQPAATTSTNTAHDVKCSCCATSLAGKIPFHRYNYKYCSTSCMHVHREMLEDG